MSSKINDTDWVLNTNEKINKEMEVLDLYEDALNVLNKQFCSIDEQYKNMNCEIKNVTDKQMEYIKDKINKSYADNHNFKLNVLNAFKVNQKNAPDFDDSIGHNVNLFHGTRSENVLGILSSNLKLPNTLNGVHKTGAMFGPGLYFANNCTKSANYSFGYWSNSNYKKGYLLICKVALGNVYEVEQSQHFNKAPNGYNSVKGKKGRYLYNNEFIVYNENQVKIEYIVEVEKI
jgi:poly [ADP-ribose] polymerase